MASIDSAHADHSAAGFYLRATASNSLGAGPLSTTVFTDAFIEVLFSNFRAESVVLCCSERRDIWCFYWARICVCAYVCVCMLMLTGLTTLLCAAGSLLGRVLSSRHSGGAVLRPVPDLLHVTCC